jgi:hypothetical protein
MADLSGILAQLEALGDDKVRKPNAGIGIHFPEYRDRAVMIGEKLGIYRDYPVSQGPTTQ